MIAMGLNHPDMTAERARAVLPDGCVAVPLDLLQEVGILLDETRYAEVPSKVLVRSLAARLNAALDRSLLLATAGDVPHPPTSA